MSLYGRKVGEAGMKEIMLPVLVLDDDCMQCDELDIDQVTRSRFYAGDECVEQEITISCKHVYRCYKLLKKLQEKNEE